jgi:Zn-dependent oligopeptidase
MHLPKFSIFLPYHLEKAAKQVLQNFQMELAELEVKLTTSEETLSLSRLLAEMDRIQAPLLHIRELSALYTMLAANPDQIQAWKDATASSSVKQAIAMAGDSSPLFQSSIVHRAVSKALDESSAPILVSFLKQGTHLDDNTNKEDKQQLREIHQDLQVVQERLQKVPSYEHASKAVRLQCVSDMYQCLGLTRMQAQLVGCHSVRDLSQRQHRHMNVDPVLWKALCDDISSFLQPFLPRHTKLNLEGAGAFLDDSNRPGNVAASTPEVQMAVLKAKYEFKQCMRLHGVLQGMIDFCDAILGIEVVEDSVAKQAGWNKNVRLLHMYEKIEDGDNIYLGTIYWDPFADAYWRTDEAEELVTTRLFSRNTQQTVAPVVVMALKIRPAWDDTPAPVGWDDTRDFLFHFGKALQMILVQASQRRDVSISKSPIDTSEILGHVREQYVQNSLDHLVIVLT